MNKSFNYNNNLLNQNKIIDYHKNLITTEITKIKDNSSNIINNLNFKIYYNFYINTNTKIVRNLDKKITQAPFVFLKFVDNI